MGYILSNALPIVVATLASLLLGFAYAASSGGRDPTTSPITLAALAVVAQGWLCCILAGALILAPKEAGSPWTMALGSAVVIWVGFVLPAVALTGVARGIAVGRTVADCLYWLCAMLLQAAVLQLIGVAKPA